MWLDGDALITNVETNLESFLKTLERDGQKHSYYEIWVYNKYGCFFSSRRLEVEDSS